MVALLFVTLVELSYPPYFLPVVSLFLHSGKCWVKSILAWSGTINNVMIFRIWECFCYQILCASLLLLLWTSLLFGKYIISLYIISIHNLVFTSNSYHHHLHRTAIYCNLQCSSSWNKNWFELMHWKQVTFKQISSLYYDKSILCYSKNRRSYFLYLANDSSSCQKGHTYYDSLFVIPF